MNKMKLLSCVVIALVATPLASAADPFTLSTVQGVVVGFEKDVLTIQPTEGRAKPIALHVTGTSRVSVAGTQSRESGVFMTQRDTEASSLTKNQKIAVVYAVLKKEPVLLSAVVTADDGK